MESPIGKMPRKDPSIRLTGETFFSHWRILEYEKSKVSTAVAKALPKILPIKEAILLYEERTVPPEFPYHPEDPRRPKK